MILSHFRSGILELLLIFVPVSCFAGTWQGDLEAHFDIVSTFDELQSWRGINNLRGYDHNQSHQPKKINGSPSIWNFYDEWSSENPNVNWIDNHGAAKVWRGVGKSLRMDLLPDHRGLVGPQRFGLYFGSSQSGVADGYAAHGLANSGYNEMYVFYMVKMPNNMFPTMHGGIWPNDEYKWWSYHKFATFCTSFTDPNHINGAASPEGTGCRWEYGCSDYLLGFSQCGSKCSSEYSNTFTQVGLDVVYDVNGSYYSQLHRLETLKSGDAEDFINLQAAAGKWFGLEVRLNRGTPGNFDGEVDVWVYDESGNARRIYSNHSLIFMQAGTDFAFNKFFFGGNVSYKNDAAAQNLDVTYYVDDFIINDTRIGPTYFKLMKGAPVKTLHVREVDPAPGQWVH